MKLGIEEDRERRKTGGKESKEDREAEKDGGMERRGKRERGGEEISERSAIAREAK